MNNKAILGISLGAVFAFSMIITPAFAGFSEGQLIDALLKDHAAGNNPAKNPAHYELIATASGNWTQYALDTTELAPLSVGDIGAVGFGMVNDTGYFHGFTSHDFDDCIANPADCSGYLPHGHGAQLDAPGACTGGAIAQIIPSSIVDLGKASVDVASDESTSEIKLKKIPADTQFNLNEDVCDVDEVSNVEPVVEFKIQVGPGGELCVVPTGGVSADGKDGPNQANNPNAKNPKPTRVGGFVCEV